MPFILNRYRELKLGVNEFTLLNNSNDIIYIIRVRASDNVIINTAFRDCSIIPHTELVVNFTLTRYSTKKTKIRFLIQNINGVRKNICIDLSSNNKYPKLF